MCRELHMGFLALMFKNALPIQNKVNKVFQMKQIFEEGVKKNLYIKRDNVCSRTDNSDF